VLHDTAVDVLRCETDVKVPARERKHVHSSGHSGHEQTARSSGYSESGGNCSAGKEEIERKKSVRYDYDSLINE
jgi:hypothetical protein